MVAPGRFQQALDAVELLSLDERRELLQIAQRRLAEDERERIAHDLEESQRELAEGNLKPMTVEEIMREVRG